MLLSALNTQITAPSDGNRQAEKYRYDAFLSYAHEDRATVEWLRKLLANYWVPWKRRRKIFMDHQSLSADGGLSEKLKDALQNSRFLIVCCSKASAESIWVNLEINEFLKSHPRQNILACLVGDKFDEAFCLPQAICDLDQNLSDALFKPDLRGQPEDFKRRTKKEATKTVLSLLAPLVNLPSKDALLDKRKKYLILTTVTLFFIVAGAIGWKAWDDSPASQINKIIADSKSLVQVGAALIGGPDYSSNKKSLWLKSLALTGRYDEALNIARSIEQKGSRADALAYVAQASVQTNNIEEAKKLAQEALNLAKELEDTYSNAQILADVARCLAQTGQTQEALMVAKNITSNPLQKDLAVAEIAQAFALRGQIQEAFTIARDIENIRPEALIKIAKTLTQIGQKDAAIAAAQEALRIAQSVTYDAAYRYQLMNYISRICSQVGLEEVAVLAMQEATNAESKIENTFLNSGAVTDIAVSLIERGEVQEAINKAKNIKEVQSRSSALQDVSNALVKRGQTQEALIVAKSIELEEVRHEALLGIALVLAQTGQTDKAASVLQATPPIPVGISDIGKSKANLIIVKVLAKLHNYRKARENANHCTYSDHKLQAYTAILREYAIDKEKISPKLFERLDSENEEEY